MLLAERKYDASFCKHVNTLTQNLNRFLLNYLVEYYLSLAVSDSILAHLQLCQCWRSCSCVGAAAAAVTMLAQLLIMFI